ncbi:protein SIEL isoform X2 [Mercurialis annua]|uniref:protein SIEL isoform X2 n=1 Tax=Mercurialis annua TaxID=3986 RepID=UPI00215FEBC2|nr:protein SIEL isoform X2 [Mercurialis annua]
MEKYMWTTCESSLNNDDPPSQQSLTIIRSLIVNPHTSISTITSILETLTRSLKLTTRRHILKLLTDLASHRPHLSSSIFNSIHSSPPTDLDSLTALASISEQNPNLKIELDDGLFVSMCFSCGTVSNRLWLLKNGDKFGVSVQVLLTLFLGFTKDPYPYVRKEALDGLVRLCKCGVVFEDNESVIEGCYSRGVELLNDFDDCVRFSAVNLVSEWGLMIIAANQEENKKDWSDTVFMQLCSVARDMSMGVRVAAFSAVGKIQMVSEEILLQTLSKKVRPIAKEKKSHSLHTAEKLKSLVANAAGAFVHGLEDEFYEVRRSACYSLHKLVILSAEFAARALNLLMDVLNDNSMVVRLEVLEILHHMAASDCLDVQEMQMHMFLGTLVDINDVIRSSARKVFKLMKLSNLELFQLSIDSLLENLDMYPQDEDDVFSVLFYMGRSHKDFTASIIKKVSREIEPDSNGNISLDSARIAAFLVLSISAPLSGDQRCQSIPPRFFSYAVTLLGRISFALKDILDQDALLEYLFQCSRAPVSSNMEVEGEEPSLPSINAYVGTHNVIDASDPVLTPLLQTGVEKSEFHSIISVESGDVGDSYAECQLDEHDQMRKSMNLMVANVKDVWQLVQSSCIDTALKTLRACKEEVAMIASSFSESTSVLAFMSQYIKIMTLLAKIWRHIVRKGQSYEIGELEILLGKLERKLREMRCKFIGFSKEEESHVLELVVLACILRLFKLEICCYRTTLKRLSATISRLEFLHEEGSIQLSNFVGEVKRTLHGSATSVGGYG